MGHHFSGALKLDYTFVFRPRQVSIGLLFGGYLVWGVRLSDLLYETPRSPWTLPPLLPPAASLSLPGLTHFLPLFLLLWSGFPPFFGPLLASGPTTPFPPSRAILASIASAFDRAIFTQAQHPQQQLLQSRQLAKLAPFEHRVALATVGTALYGLCSQYLLQPLFLL